MTIKVSRKFRKKKVAQKKFHFNGIDLFLKLLKTQFDFYLAPGVLILKLMSIFTKNSIFIDLKQFINWVYFLKIE